MATAKGVEVYSENAVEGPLGPAPEAFVEGSFRCQRSSRRREAAQDEVPAAAGRVNHPEAGQPELV